MCDPGMADKLLFLSNSVGYQSYSIKSVDNFQVMLLTNTTK